MSKDRMRTVLDTGETQFVMKGRFTNRDEELVQHSRMHLGLKGAIAEKLLSHFGIVAVEPDGVDDTGRQKLRLLSPYDVVDRAVEIADLFIEEVNRRGWVNELPRYEDLFKPDEAEE